MIILVNAGKRVLTNPNMDEIAGWAGAKVWWQVAIPPLTESQAEELERRIALVVTEFQSEITGEKL